MLPLEHGVGSSNSPKSVALEQSSTSISCSLLPTAVKLMICDIMLFMQVNICVRTLADR